MQTVSTYTAKTHLASLLSAAENGDCIVITRHNKPIAQLSPVHAASSPMPPLNNDDARDALAQIRAIAAESQNDGTPMKELLREGLL